MKLCPECYSEYEDDLKKCPDDGVELTKYDPDPLIGKLIAERYKVVSVLGKGGMGMVYKGEHESLGRTVAIKMLHSHMVSNAEAVKRFHREAKAVSRVKHPHTIKLFDFGISEQGQPYLVTDYIEGTNLKRVIKEEGKLSLDRAHHIFKQVIQALACAHEQGVVHRDLKPENIMLTYRNEDPDYVEVVDFGISKLAAPDPSDTFNNITKVGDVCGSPPYMSPEQCIGAEPVDIRSDIYSLGVLVYESLSGRLPLKGKNAIEMIDSHIYSSPKALVNAHDDLQLCSTIDAVLMKALEKDPDKRYETMKEFGDELETAIKRDIQKLSILKHRADVFKLEVEAAVAATAADKVQEAAEAGDTGSGVSPVSASGAAGRSDSTGSREMSVQVMEDSWLDRLRAFVFGDKSSDVDNSYVLDYCPYCSAEIKPGVSFCIQCQRSLVSPQQMTALRKAQRVFSYPKSHRRDNQSSDSNPEIEFSARSRKALARVGVRNRPLFILNLLFIVILCFVVLSNEVARTTIFKGIHDLGAAIGMSE